MDPTRPLPELPFTFEGRVAILGRKAEGWAAAMSREGLPAETFATDAGDAAGLLTRDDPAEPFGALVWPRDFVVEPPALRLRLLNRLRRWLRPEGWLFFEGIEWETVRQAGFQLRVPSQEAPHWSAARPGSTPPQGLAVATHQPAGDPPQLDLRWCPDEGDWLNPTPVALWEPLWRRDPAEIAADARHYGLDDPYGGARSASTLAAHFGCALAAEQITWSAGTTALLHDLAPLAHGGPVLAPALAHPDLAAWATAAGAPVHFLPIEAGPADWRSAILRLSPGLVHLDRPGLAGRRMPLDDLESLARTAAEAGAIVLVDEAYGSYFAAAESAVPLAGRLPNLVVLRSLSKAYLSGGLRAGFAIASRAVAAEVRERASPLGISALSLQMALALLAAGDLFGGLRSRVREVKAQVVDDLERLGLSLWPGEPELPWVLVQDSGGGAWRTLAARGIAGKRLGLSPLPAAAAPPCFRLSIPLSPERVAQWTALCAP